MYVRVREEDGERKERQVVQDLQKAGEKRASQITYMKKVH